MSDGKEIILKAEDSIILFRENLAKRGLELAARISQNLYLVKPKEIKRLIGHKDKITFLKFSDNGKVLASGSHDKTLRLWEIESENSKKFDVLDEVLCADFFQDSKKMVSGDKNGCVEIWDTENGKKVNEFIGIPKISRRDWQPGIVGIKVGRNEDHVITVCSDDCVRIFDEQLAEQLAPSGWQTLASGRSHGAGHQRPTPPSHDTLAGRQRRRPAAQTHVLAPGRRGGGGA